MMKLKDASRSQRVVEARGRWRKHVSAQRASGQTQVAYCRSQGLDASYFSMGLTRVIEELDVPKSERTCKECGAPMRPSGVECSEHLHYVPASIQILETRRKKYACGGCHDSIVRAPIANLQPLPKSMASASLLACLIVSKFADGLPLHRMAACLQRLGVDLSHTLMSDWLTQCVELLEDLHRRMIRKVLYSGHVFTDDISLPLQNDDTERSGTIRAKLWVYARYRRRHKPLVTYEFSRSRSQEAPLGFLKDYRAYLQADAFPRYRIMTAPDSPWRLPPRIGRKRDAYGITGPSRSSTNQR